MITQQNLDQIKNILDLEKISVIQTLTICCFPKKKDSDFVTKLIDVEKEISKLGPNVYLKIVKEGETVNDSIIEIPFTGTGDGTS